MKILHTADWHLGKYLDQFSRLEEQHEVLDEICQIAAREAVDAVIVAGDLFDTFSPSNEASELLLKTLHRLADNGNRAVIAIAGNHDSPERIDMPDVLARECGILFVGLPLADIQPFTTGVGLSVTRVHQGFVELKLPKQNTLLRLLLTPFPNESRLRKYLGKEQDEGLRQMLMQHWRDLETLFCDSKGVNILVSHLYMMQEGGEAPEEPEGEKPISPKVGGAQAIFTNNVPENIQYVALGHLHRYQNLGTATRPIIYSGSPLAYSFAEAEQEKYVAIIDIEANQTPKVTRIALKGGLKLLRNRFENVDHAIVWLSKNQDAYVKLTMVSDTYLSGEENKRLHDAHSRLTIIPEIKSETQKSENQSIDLNEHTTEELFVKYFHREKGQAPDDALMALFRECLSADS